MPSTNPFSFDTIVTGKSFCNRKSEIQELLNDMTSSHNVVLFSQRRYGKTSLIINALNLAKDKGFLTIYVDIYHILNEQDLVNAYAKALATNMEGSIEKILKTFKTILSSLRPKITLDDGGKPEIEFGVESGRDPLMNLEEVFESVKKYTERSGTRAVVVFDEFQQVGELKQSHRIESIIRSQIQAHRNICYVFMGSKRHLIVGMFSDPARPLYGIGKMFPLGKIDPDHLIQFVQSRFAKSGKPILEDVVVRLVDTCESHPYYTQYVSHSLWELTQFNSSISTSDLEDALTLTINRISPRYENLWELLPIRQRQALIALSNLTSTQRPFSGDIILKYGLASASAFRRALTALIDKGIVDKDKAEYSIIDIFLKKWIQRNFPHS
jgi:uncharacterized protein